MIYFLRMECPDRFIKIGFATDLKPRIWKLKTASPYELTVVRALPGSRTDERLLHLYFSRARVRLEWFRPVPDLLSYIEDTAPICLGQNPPADDLSEAALKQARKDRESVIELAINKRLRKEEEAKRRIEAMKEWDRRERRRIEEERGVEHLRDLVKCLDLD